MSGRCFVMQPLDKGPFDKRYDDVFAPAISEAGLEPYRVDRDPTVSIPIDDIGAGIQSSIACLADISIDNPNVWFELGYAIAAAKDVVLVCSEERTTKYPFDVQHRNIIRYATDSPSDFVTLGARITERLNAIVRKQKDLKTISSITPLKDTAGMSPAEVIALVSIMSNRFVPGSGVTPHVIRDEMNNAGYTDLAVSLALDSLLRKEVVEFKYETTEWGQDYEAYVITRGGIDWLQHNIDTLKLRHDGP